MKVRNQATKWNAASEGYAASGLMQRTSQSPFSFIFLISLWLFFEVLPAWKKLNARAMV